MSQPANNLVTGQLGLDGPAPAGGEAVSDLTAVRPTGQAGGLAAPPVPGAQSASRYGPSAAAAQPAPAAPAPAPASYPTFPTPPVVSAYQPQPPYLAQPAYQPQAPVLPVAPTYPTMAAGYYMPPAYMVIPHAPTNGLAVAALVCALVGVFVVPLAGSAVAIVLGAVALRQVKARNQAGRGMALAGLIVGIVGLVMWGFGIAAIIVTSDDYTYPEYNYTMSQLMTHFSPQLEVSL